MFANFRFLRGEAKEPLPDKLQACVEKDVHIETERFWQRWEAALNPQSAFRSASS